MSVCRYDRVGSVVTAKLASRTDPVKAIRGAMGPPPPPPKAVVGGAGKGGGKGQEARQVGGQALFA